MYKFKIFFSVSIFLFLMVGISIIKNETREIDKKIFKISKSINQKDKDLSEAQLDFSYLTSPSKLEEKINHLDSNQYIIMENSKIFLSISDFINIQNKIVHMETLNEKIKNRKKSNVNQSSFFFEDYLKQIKKIKSYRKIIFFKTEYIFYFFLFFSLILIFSIRIVHVSLNKIEVFEKGASHNKFTLLRRDIVDRNGIIISRNIKSYHAAINQS